MGKFRDITGQKFGMLTALQVAGKDSTNKTTWKCVCDCGNHSVATMLNLVSGTSKSCGCKRNVSRSRADHSGKRFGNLVAISPVSKLSWLCKCDCGSSHVARTVHLTRQHTTSCGCKPKRLPASAYGEKQDGVFISNNGWTAAVKREAEHGCDACGKKSNLHAHHIIPYQDWEFGKKWTDNGSCLCASCHRKVHKKIRAGTAPATAFTEVLIEEGNSPHMEAVKKLLHSQPSIAGMREFLSYINREIERLSRND